MIEIEDFGKHGFEGNTVKDLIDLLSKLDHSKPLYFTTPVAGGNLVRDVNDLAPGKGSIVDGTDDGYTIYL